MHRIATLGAAALAALAASAAVATSALGAQVAPAASAEGGAVFVQNDRLGGNQVVAYSRSDEGTLTQAGVYDTGGNGGQLEGSVVDHTASQGALALDSADGLLFAVNAGSNTISVFSVTGTNLKLRQVIGSGGVVPGQRHRQRGIRVRAQRRKRRVDPGTRARPWTAIPDTA